MFTFRERAFTFGERAFTFGEQASTFGDNRGFRVFWNLFFVAGVFFFRNIQHKTHKHFSAAPAIVPGTNGDPSQDKRDKMEI